jgi:hypothetical protein
MKHCVIIIISFSIHLVAMAQGLAPYNACNVIAPFVQKLGNISTNCAFSTNESLYKGVVLVDFTNNKIYQDSSWKQYGNMGPLAIDAKGNVYVAPVPVVNVLDNKRQDQNKIYCINSTTGKMNLLINLGNNSIDSKANPYGVVGLFYDCNSKLLYATSIFGSTLNMQKGKVYCINTTNQQIVWQQPLADAMGIALGSVNNKSTLFLGSIKSRQVVAYPLTKRGIASNQKQVVFNLNNFGPRGDDIARKIRITSKGELQVTASPFYYNLTAPTFKQESKLTLVFSNLSQSWKLTNLENNQIPLGF